MFTTMKNIFRMPPSPFQLGKPSSKPVILNPIKVRRSSSASVQESPLILRSSPSQGADQIKDMRESDVDDYGEANGLGQGTYHSIGNGMSSPPSRQTKPSANSNEVAGKNDKQSSDSPKDPAAVQHTVKEHRPISDRSINTSFVDSAGLGESQDQVAAVLTPPPSSHDRKRRSSDRSDEGGETRKKRKRSRESDILHSEKKAPKSSSGKHKQKSQSHLPLSPEHSRESTIENADEKEKKRRLKKERKLERKRKKMERQTSETGSQWQPTVTSSLRNETFPDKDIEGATVSSQGQVTFPDKFRVFEFDESPEPAHKPSAKKRKQQQLEITASVEPPSLEDGDPDHSLNIESPSSHHQPPPSKKKSNKTRKDDINLDESHDEVQTQTPYPVPPEGPALEAVANVASQEIPEERRNANPSPRRRRSKSQEQQKYLSSERIVDSSGDEKDGEEAEPKRPKTQSLAKSRTPKISTVQTKIGKPGKGLYSREESDVVDREVNQFQLVSHSLNINLL
jgi:hypothetical protein